jgi:hypothetical protein
MICFTLMHTFLSVIDIKKPDNIKKCDIWLFLIVETVVSLEIKTEYRHRIQNLVLEEPVC